MITDLERHSAGIESHQEALHLYLDGDLPVAEQPRLFCHLADCETCRRLMDAVMEFRRMSRRDVCEVPPEVDHAIFGELNKSATRDNRRDRYWDRRPLWQSRRTVSLRTGTLCAVLLFGAGLLFPHDTAVLPDATVVTETAEDLQPTAVYVNNVLYFMAPDLFIEASQADD